MASNRIFGVPWIRTVMSSIFCCSLAAISVQPKVPSQIVARSRQGTIPDHHRQAEELGSCQSNDPVWCYPRYPAICQQSRRDFASAHSDERTTNAPIQIPPASSALSIAPRCRPKSILRWATFVEMNSSPTLEISVLRSLANGNGGLTISNSPSPISPNSFRIA